MASRNKRKSLKSRTSVGSTNKSTPRSLLENIFTAGDVQLTVKKNNVYSLRSSKKSISLGEKTNSHVVTITPRTAIENVLSTQDTMQTVARKPKVTKRRSVNTATLTHSSKASSPRKRLSIISSESTPSRKHNYLLRQRASQRVEELLPITSTRQNKTKPVTSQSSQEDSSQDESVYADGDEISLFRKMNVLALTSSKRLGVSVDNLKNKLREKLLQLRDMHLLPPANQQLLEEAANTDGVERDNLLPKYVTPERKSDAQKIDSVTDDQAKADSVNLSETSLLIDEGSGHVIDEGQHASQERNSSNVQQLDRSNVIKPSAHSSPIDAEPSTSFETCAEDTAQMSTPVQATEQRMSHADVEKEQSPQSDFVPSSMTEGTHDSGPLHLSSIRIEDNNQASPNVNEQNTPEDHSAELGIFPQHTKKSTLVKKAPSLRNLYKSKRIKKEKKKKPSATIVTRSQLKGILQHHTGLKVTSDAVEQAEVFLGSYLKRFCEDMEAMAAHGGRNTIQMKDIELIMRRQRLVTDDQPLKVLIEEKLPMEYQDLLLPIAYSVHRKT